MISLKSIRTAANAASYTRGNQVYKRNKVFNFQRTEDRDTIELSADVEGSYDNEYHVHLRYNKKGDYFEDDVCECEAWQSYSGMCKHCVAVALEAFYSNDTEKKNSKASSAPPAIKAKKTDKELTDIIYASSMKEKARFLQPDLTGHVELVPIFRRESGEWSLEFKIGAANKYVLKNINQMVEAMDHNEWVEYGKKLSFYHERSVLTPQSRNILKLLEQYVLHEKEVMQVYNRRSGFYYHSYYSSSPETLTKRKLTLTDEWMVRFARVLVNGDCNAENAGYVAMIDNEQVLLTFKEGNPLLKTSVKAQADGGYGLEIPGAEVFQGKSRVCIRVGSVIYVCGQEFSEHFRLIGSLFQGKKKSYSIHPEDAPAFCASVLPILKGYTSCQVDTKMEQYEPQPCQIQVYFDRGDKRITAKAVCFYGELSYNVIEPITVSEMYRDFEKEHVLVEMMAQFFLYRDLKDKVFFIPEEEEEAVYDLISEGIGCFQQLGQVFVTESLKRIQIMQVPRIRVGITMRAGLLDVDIKAEQLPLEELEGILEGYRKRRKFFRLPDGSFLKLEDNALSSVAELAEGLELKGSQLAEGHLQIPGYRSFYLDQILRENEGDMQVSRDKAFKALLRDMRNVEDSDFEEPEGLLAELRPYQKFGYRWMMTLRKLGFGGILADDMGLGKTIQTIAYFLALKQGIGGTVLSEKTEKTEYLGLVICPASLVYNWESEIQRFAPSLSVVTVTGSAPMRRQKINGGTGDILLTSYDLLKRDVDCYQDILFQNTIIDEAQNIKNYTTQAAKAVKTINSVQRFALTGTPIENSLSELWSIFDFLMPGILNSNKQFRTKYEQPITSNQDERVSARLRKMIRPYILRRVKSEVLKELPDKIEKVIYSKMEEKQKNIYDANLQRLLLSLKKQSAEEFRTGKLQILAELTKLRQLCCDPSLVYENYDGGSAKMETCMDLIRGGVSAGSQILLFSQFTTALDRIGKRLDAERIPYYMLTGATSKEKRAQLVAAFNQDKTPVFLISLKAGGTGLNLTAASVVIHFDPWWNMAAQNQATDRAHRIGQRQVVTVYKLLTKDTLEEKIQKLQEQKAQLSDEIISEGSIRDTLATKEELFAILQG